MPQFDGVISFLDSRSFGSIWFWLVLVGLWSAMGRTVIGVPADVLLRARRAQRDEPEGTAVIVLLDWLSLTLPRWHMGRREGVVFLAVTAFLLTSLAIMGFRYDLEMAQALTLLLVPLLILFVLRLRLARKLIPMLEAGQLGEVPVADVGAVAVRSMSRHRHLVTILSIIAVMVAVFWGMWWMLLHPNGL